MRGVSVTKVNLVHEDERRGIWEVLNGQMSIKNIKILKIKQGESVLGNHWHAYPEIMYMMKGKARYKMKNIFTQEIEEYNLEEGDIVFRAGFITHAGVFEEDSVILEGGSEAYIDGDFNDVVERVI